MNNVALAAVIIVAVVMFFLGDDPSNHPDER